MLLQISYCGFCAPKKLKKTIEKFDIHTEMSHKITDNTSNHRTVIQTHPKLETLKWFTIYCVERLH